MNRLVYVAIMSNCNNKTTLLGGRVHASKFGKGIEEKDDDVLDDGVELHRMGKLKRSPETVRNIQIFVSNFEDVNFGDDELEYEHPKSLANKFSNLNKYYQASSFSIDSWSIDSTISAGSRSLTNDKNPTSVFAFSPKGLVLCAVLLCTVVIFVLLGFGIFEENETRRLYRNGKYVNIGMDLIISLKWCYYSNTMKIVMPVGLNCTIVMSFFTIYLKPGRNLNDSKDPVDCQWSSWVESPCSATCQRKLQALNNVFRVKLRMEAIKPLYGGRNCSGNFIEYESCTLDKCKSKFNIYKIVKI